MTAQRLKPQLVEVSIINAKKNTRVGILFLVSLQFQHKTSTDLYGIQEGTLLISTADTTDDSEDLIVFFQA